MTPLAILVHAHLIIASHVWWAVEAQYPVLMPKILSALELEPPFSEADICELEVLGVYQARTIPLYSMHLRNPKNASDTSRVLGVMLNIKSHTGIFLPYAVRGLDHEDELHTSLQYLISYGTRMQAHAVAAVLLNYKFKDTFPELVLHCLKRIGGQEELGVLAKFSAKNFARNRIPLLIAEINECRKAIEARLAAEAKASAGK